MDEPAFNSQDILDRLGPWRAVLVPRLGAALAVLAMVGVGWWMVRPAGPPVESTIPLAGATSTTTGAEAAAPSTTVEGDVVVAAAGAVARPGVYRLDPGDRVQDLVDAAGGLLASADGDRVNLAAPVSDGERVWVPAEGDEEVPSVVAGTGGGPSGGDDATSGPEELIDLNQASESELEELPGVGPATAQAIASHRATVGRFRSVDELLDVRGIGEAKLAQIRPLVRV